MIDALYKIFLKYRKISTDTRKEINDSLFFALSGENFNGNLFAADALSKGAALAVVDDPSVVPEDDKRYFLVGNVLDTLQAMAKFHRNQFNIPVLGITGTNGKTTTKELVSAVLETEKNILYTRGNLNNHIGVPLTLLQLNEEIEIAVVEMGANHPGEIGELCALARPTHGIITNIGKAHLEGFGSFENVIRTKNELYESVRTDKGTVFVPQENPLLMELSEGINRITYGSSGTVAGSLEAENPFLSVRWMKEHNLVHLNTRMYGSYNFQNIMAAVAVGNYFGISESGIQKALAEYSPQNNRSQMMKTDRNTLLMDAYNANPDSLKLAIEDFGRQQLPNKMVIVGDMFELGKQAREEHQHMVELIQSQNFEKVILVGKDFCATSFPTEFLTFATTDDAENYLKANPVKESTILIKGSRGMHLEQLIKQL
ncbi:MAG: UDP-N-acetylmuramoyl-tripeptide--D-alanyl-D-alanine ligase [Bacteroidales bacterium]|nr:UDP-N-acetylmuramoyl-tripeptide--D-alanyl-D-alanine ligase [Bacteroidales bacterium]